MKTSIKIQIGITALSFILILSTRIWVEAYTKEHPAEYSDPKSTYRKPLPLKANKLCISGDIQVIITNKNTKKKEPYITADSSKLVEIKDGIVTIKPVNDSYKNSKVYVYNWVPSIIHVTNKANVTFNIEDKLGSLKVECLNSSEFDLNSSIDSIEAMADLNSRLYLGSAEKYAKININRESSIDILSASSGILTGNVRNNSGCTISGNFMLNNLSIDESSRIDKHKATTSYQKKDHWEKKKQRNEPM